MLRFAILAIALFAIGGATSQAFAQGASGGNASSGEGTSSGQAGRTGQTPGK